MNESIRMKFLEERDGKEQALVIAKRNLEIYRCCARNRKHFAHNAAYRASYVQSITYLRNYIRQNETTHS